MRKLLVGAAIWAAMNAGLVQATTMQVTEFDKWYAFDVDDLSSKSGSTEWIDVIDDFGAPLSFAFSLAQPAVLRVVDAGFAGDRFSVTLAGSANLALTTSAAVDSFPTSLDFDSAWADSRYSRLTQTLAAGTYTVTGSLLASAGGGAPLNVTTGALMLTPVPEASAWILMLAGLGMVLGSRRCRASRRGI
jgi:hypothetical protein